MCRGRCQACRDLEPEQISGHLKSNGELTVSHEIYANAQVDLATALSQQQSAAATGQKGDIIAVGDGNNTIVGSNGNDAIFTGTGNNTIACGPGSVTVIGGVEVRSTSRDWTEVNGIFTPIDAACAPFNAPTPYYGSTFGGVPLLVLFVVLSCLPRHKCRGGVL